MGDVSHGVTVVTIPIVSSTLGQQLWPQSEIHLYCVTVVPRPEVHACWGNGRSRAQGQIHTGVTEQEARKDLAERDQPNSQDSVDAEIEHTLQDSHYFHRASWIFRLISRGDPKTPVEVDVPVPRFL